MFYVLPMRDTSVRVDGPEVRRRRKEMGLEIADVAARVGISRSFLSRIERHSAPVRPRTLKALRTALDCDAADLSPQDEDDTKEETCPSSSTSPTPLPSIDP